MPDFTTAGPVQHGGAELRLRNDVMHVCSAGDDVALLRRRAHVSRAGTSRRRLVLFRPRPRPGVRFCLRIGNGANVHLHELSLELRRRRLLTRSAVRPAATTRSSLLQSPTGWLTKLATSKG